MPIHVRAEIRRPTPDEFSTIAYDVMHHVFAMHNEFGRFLREEIYQQELAVRRPGLQREMLIEDTDAVGRNKPPKPLPELRSRGARAVRTKRVFPSGFGCAVPA